jgi:hypothetical protein
MIIPFPGSEPDEMRGQQSSAGVRRTGRKRCHTLVCEFGEIVDLSADGMRIRQRGGARVKQNDQIVISISFMSNEVQLKARVIWSRKTGFRRREIGLQFVELAPQVKSTLEEIVQCASKIEQLHAVHAA